MIDLVLNTWIGQVVMVFKCIEGMPQGQNLFVYQSKSPKLMNVSFFAVDLPIPTCDCIILWYCVQDQTFAICDFFNVLSDTMTKYQHIFSFESMHELGYFSYCNQQLHNMFMGFWMLMH